MSASVQVKFAMTEDSWNKVVLECSAGSGCSVTNEGEDYFIVEYPSQDKFEDELIRLEGVIEYEVLK